MKNMIRFYKILFSVVALSATGVSVCVGQCTQKGVVYEYLGPNQRKPLANVEIVVANASSVISGKNGEFELNFRNQVPGSKVNVRRIQKNGFEIFNQEEVDQWYITTGEDPFYIVLVKTERLNEARANLLAKAQKQLHQQLEKDRKTITVEYKKNRITKEEYEKRKKKLEREYQTQLQNIDNYIDRFLLLDMNALSEKEQDIVRLVKEARFLEAIERYEQADLIGKFEQQFQQQSQLENDVKAIEGAEEELRRQRQRIQNSIARQIDLLRMHGQKQNNNRINQILHDVAYADTTDLDQMFVYARDLRSLGRYDEALRVYTELMDRAVGMDDHLQMSRAEMFMGMVQIKMGNPQEGDYHLENGLIHFAEEANRQDNMHYWPDVAYGYEQVGLRKSLYFKYDEAREYFKTGLQMMESVVLDANFGSNPSLQSQYGVMQVIAGRELRKSHWIVESERLIKRGISTLDPLYQKKNYLYAASLAFAWNCLGQVYYTIGDNYLNDCEDAYLTALKYYEESSRRNPEAYRRYEAECRYNLGAFYMTVEDYNKAVECFKWSETVWKEETNRHRSFESYLSDVYFDLGKCYYFMHDFEKALEYDLLDLEVTEPLYKKEPIVYKDRMGTCLLHMANTHFALGNYEESMNYCRRAMTVDPTYRETRELFQKLKGKLGK